LADTYGINVSVITEGLEKAGAAHRVYDEVKQLGIEVQYLVNNAGFNVYGDFQKTDLSEEVDMINLHITCTTEMMKLFIPDMVKNKYGRVMNLGSTGSFMPCPNDAVYAATKAYVLSISKGVNAELKGTGVSITALCPGSTKTEFARKAGMEHTLLFKLFVMNPETVAHIGYKALMRRKPHVIAGIYNKILVLSSKLLPSFILTPVTKKMMQ